MSGGTASPDKAPILQSTSMGARAAELRAESTKRMRADRHADYLRQVEEMAGDAMTVDVVVFLDWWEDPKLTSTVTTPPPPNDDMEAFTRPAHRPSRIFESGLASAHAIGWNPMKQEVVCAAQAQAINSAHITLRPGGLVPLQQDLVLELERVLQRSFVAPGDGPPQLQGMPAEERRSVAE